jgi:ubiquitin-activating enzyme E1
LARISGIDDNFTEQELGEMIQNYQPVIKNLKETSVQETSVQESSLQFRDTFVPQEFEKDDDTNWHINWINMASNMRALNYGIPVVDYQQTKGIAGRIIPAIATTTSAVSGLILIEMLKYLMGFNKVEQYRSTFINLAEPVLVYSDPIEAPLVEISGIKINSWTKFEYTKDSTIGEFKDFYDKQFKTNITMIVIGTSMIYAEFLGADSLKKKLSETIKEVFETEHVQSNVSVSLATDDEIELPSITINLN